MSRGRTPAASGLRTLAFQMTRGQCIWPVGKDWTPGRFTCGDATELSLFHLSDRLTSDNAGPLCWAHARRCANETPGQHRSRWYDRNWAWKADKKLCDAAHSIDPEAPSWNSWSDPGASNMAWCRAEWLRIVWDERVGGVLF